MEDRITVHDVSFLHAMKTKELGRKRQKPGAGTEKKEEKTEVHQTVRNVGRFRITSTE